MPWGNGKEPGSMSCMRICVLWLVAAFVGLGCSGRPPDPMAAERGGRSLDGMTKVHVYTVGWSSSSGGAVVVLSDRVEQTFLVIGIGTCEAEAIQRVLKEVRTPRPMTHDLLRSVVEGLDAKVLRILVTHLKSNVYYGKIVVRKEDDSTVEIDARPSDAIALALRAEVPIYVADRIMRENGIGDGEGKSWVARDGGTRGQGDKGTRGRGDKVKVDLQILGSCLLSSIFSVVLGPNT